MYALLKSVNATWAEYSEVLVESQTIYKFSSISWIE